MEEIHCKYCNSSNISKKGKLLNKQRYLCKDCGKHFRFGDDRVKRDIKQRELCLLLYSYNMSLRSIQNIIEKQFDTKISFRLIEKWIKSFAKLLQYDIDKQKQQNQLNKKPETIEILELDELYSYFYDLKKNKKNMLKYGLLLTETEVKLLHIK